MTDIKLKPCPFCGGEAKIRTKTFDIFNVAAYVYCTRCGAKTGLFEANVNRAAVEEAKELWNKRSDD